MSLESMAKSQGYESDHNSDSRLNQWATDPTQDDWSSKGMFDAHDWNSKINTLKNWWNGNIATDQLNARQNARQEETYMRERAYDFRLAQLAEQKSAVNQAMGMQAAGMTPIADSISAGNGSSGSTSQPTGGNSKGASSDPFALAQLDNLAANTENVRAQTEKTKQETQNLSDTNSGILTNNKTLESQRSMAEREAEYKRQYDSIFVQKFKQEYKASYDKMLNYAVSTGMASDEESFDEGLTSGAFDAEVRFTNQMAQVASDSVEKLVSEKVLEDPEIVKAMASMPRAEQAKMRSEIHLLGIQASDLAYNLELQKKYASRFKDEELSKLQTDILKQKQDVNESIERINKMAVDKFKSGTESFKNIMSGISQIVGVAANFL